MARTEPIDAERLATTARLAALTIANAFIFQAELAQVDSRVTPIRTMLEEDDLVGAFAEHWQFICRNINYIPIFSLARRVIVELPPRDEVKASLKSLGEHVLAIVSQRAALKHDLMGRIYHRLLQEAKYLGTFYTSIPTATFLLKIALNPSAWTIDWSDVGSITNLKIADIACGTGTLLMAAQQAITDNFIHSLVDSGRAVDGEDIKRLYVTLIEDVLHGYDVLSTAVHLTASTLALLAPEVAFRRMKLWYLPIGVDAAGGVNLGSIDFLSTEGAPKVAVSLVEDVAGGTDPTPEDRPARMAVTGEGDVLSTGSLPQLDLCVMNPPFTRSVGGNLLFGSLPAKERSVMQAKMRRLLADRSHRAMPVLASATAGLGSVFVAVANQYLKAGGRMALVLPAALASGVAWKKTRELFAQGYVVEYLVSSHDPDQWNFSENTSLSEVLVVARKRSPADNERDSAHTVCINLWRNMGNVADSLALADAVSRTQPADVDGDGTLHGVSPVMVGGTKWGEMVQVPWTSLLARQWYPGAFAQTDLVRAAHFLQEERVYLPARGVVSEIGMTRLRDLGDLGPDRRDVYDGFTVGPSATSYPAFWGHEADSVRSIGLRPNAYLTPRMTAQSGRHLRNVAVLWPRAGRFMLGERLWLKTQRVVAVRLSEPALSNVWWPLSVRDLSEEAEKALALWMNSTLGLLGLLSSRVPTRGPWVQFKKPILEDLLVLDVRRLTDTQLHDLASAYDSLANSEMLPLPTMGRDPVRALIDDRLGGTLGIPSLSVLRQALGREPIVSGVRL